MADGEPPPSGPNGLCVAVFTYHMHLATPSLFTRVNRDYVRAIPVAGLSYSQ